MTDLNCQVLEASLQHVLRGRNCPLKITAYRSHTHDEVVIQGVMSLHASCTVNGLEASQMSRHQLANVVELRLKQSIGELASYLEAEAAKLRGCL